MGQSDQFIWEAWPTLAGDAIRQSDSRKRLDVAHLCLAKEGLVGLMGISRGVLQGLYGRQISAIPNDRLRQPFRIWKTGGDAPWFR